MLGKQSKRQGCCPQLPRQGHEGGLSRAGQGEAEQSSPKGLSPAGVRAPRELRLVPKQNGHNKEPKNLEQDTEQLWP